MKQIPWLISLTPGSMTRHVIDDLILPIMLEIKAVASAAGVQLPEGIEDLQIRLDPPDEDFLPSMGQDAAKVGSIGQQHVPYR